MPDPFNTVRMVRFIEGTVPRLVTALEKIAGHLERLEPPEPEPIVPPAPTLRVTEVDAILAQLRDDGYLPQSAYVMASQLLDQAVADQNPPF